MQKEIFKDVIGFEGLYQISNFGNVKSLKYGKERILKPAPNSDGYLQVMLSKNSTFFTKKVHRLIAMAFMPNYNNLSCINHIDGNKLNNDISNLEWCTQKENVRHAFDIGLSKPLKGEANGRAKLTKNQVLMIRDDNRSQRRIAKDYNISKTMVACIKNRKSWSHI